MDAWNLGIFAGCCLLLFAFVSVLHLWDSKKAYQYSAQTRDDLLKKLPDNMSAEDIARVADIISKPPDGISGTTRAIVTYSLVLVLACGILYLLAKFGTPNPADTADKLLTLLSGALTSIIGFYFGTKATVEGVAAQKGPKSEVVPADPPTHIDSLQPSTGKSGDVVVIRGGGFGATNGNVEFGGISVAAGDIQSWSDKAITIRLPPGLPAGPVDVSVNPAVGKKALAHGLFEISQ